jgi:hypothetical protein
MSTLNPTPDDLLARHPETAYFWGHVAGGGQVTDQSISIEVSDEIAAQRLSAIAGGGTVDHRIATREFAHDTTVTRQAEEYTVQVVDPALTAKAAAALGLPRGTDPGGYRFDTLRDHRQELLRGLLEACGVVCFRESSAAVGISFVHENERLLDRIRTTLDAEGFAADTLESSSSGGYWFGVDDDDTAAFGKWVYETSAETGLFAPSRRRKTLRSVERASGLEVGSLIQGTDTEESPS